MNMVFAYLVVGVTVIIAYLLGSINSSIIVGKVHGIEIREHGSKNAGLTNTLRVLGKKAAGFVLVGDILKGVIAILIAKFLTPYVLQLIAGTATDMNMYINNALTIASLTTLAVQLSGIAAVLGHIFPVYYRFKGGKGVLTSFTVLMMTQWQVGLCCLAIFIITVLLTRYVSLGSVLCAISAPFLLIGLSAYIEAIDGYGWFVFGAVLAVLVIWCHRGNIVRLLKNTERKLGEKKEDYEKRIEALAK